MVIDALQGKVWRKLVEKTQLPALQATHNVISSRLFAGKTVVHVLADAAPDNSSESVTPDLEDVYFSAIKNYELKIRPGVPLA
ncbi:hypothetical protein [Hymenobacter sp.]|jgi:hypothetical protein|uniref:hypothetical protein n=1 Tax=Hymenobacter sp. TaxID=1898978 RepID=UPI002EDB25B8